jgi:outer membrane protein assembly factor BamB
VGLPDAIDVADAAWTFDRSGRGAPVIAEGRVYAMAYEGRASDLEEMIVCLDEATGELIWEHRFSDFLSDIIYNRYSISSPCIDAETGNVYCMTTPGLLNCFSRDGQLLWQVPMMERFGRLTYPNGRTLGPLVDGDLVIFHNMTSNWGPEGPARDRFFAFDKVTGEHVWTSTPGGPPKDAPYSHPVFEWRDGKRLLYAGTAGGNIVCVNARNGEPVWRYQISIGGVCASPVLDGDHLIAVHGKENLDTSGAGRMLAIKLGAAPDPGGGQLVLDQSAEVWRNDELTSFTSSPVLAEGIVYNTVFTGDLFAVDAGTGETLWKQKLAPDQIHASPLFADGKLYVPMNNGTFHVLRPDRSGAEVLSQTQLEGACLGAPSVWNGRIYVHTTEKLYCFAGGMGGLAASPPVERAPSPGPAAALQVIPAEVSVLPGETVRFRARTVDANGNVVTDSVDGIEWGPSPLGLEAALDGFVVRAGDTPGAASVPVTAGDLEGRVRFRITYPATFTEDFEDIELTSRNSDGEQFGRTPGFWISGWPKWEVRVVGDSKVLAKTLDNPILQRTMGFVGDPSMSNYTMQADIMTEGNRRIMSGAGVVNQRYLIILQGNTREIEIQSNEERIKHRVPFPMTPGVWYTLKTRVDLDESGAATVRAKAWPRDETEPEAWTIEFTHKNGHRHGAPGIYGFAPQSRVPVYIDNIRVTPN